MAVRNAIYLPSNTDLAASGTWDVAEAPAAPWDAGSTVTFAAGGPVVTTNNNALGAINLASFKVGPGCSLPMGAAGDPLYVYANSSSGLVDYNGAAPLNYFRGGTTKTVKTFQYRPVVQSMCTISDMDISTNLIVGSLGTVKVTSSVTLTGVYVYGSGQLFISSHSSDTVDDIHLSGRATCTLQRPQTGSSNRIYVPAGCTLIVDITATSGSTVSAGSLVGTIVLQGGTVILKNGNIIVDGTCGTLDYSRLERPATVTITGAPDATEIEGPVTATVTRTAIGPGPTIVRRA